jgi:SAM-dependent methyltransferase
MAYPTEPNREHPSTYYVQDRSNQEEMTRLDIHDRMLTAGMGGVLPELADPASLRRVLDVGCGTGGWLRETARTYPTIEKLVGVDVSSSIIEYARTQVENQQLDQRVQFRTMDALRTLDFPDASFDLVNQRAGISWLRTWEWRKILLEYQRVSRPGAIIRITEPNIDIESNSPAFTKLNTIFAEANYHSGRFFTPTGDGVIGELAPLMQQHGVQDVQTQLYPIVCRAGTVQGQSFYENMSIGLRVALPFFQKWTRVPGDYEQIYQQALKEMQEPDFVATWTFLTVWGTGSL